MIPWWRRQSDVGKPWLLLALAALILLGVVVRIVALWVG